MGGGRWGGGVEVGGGVWGRGGGGGGRGRGGEVRLPQVCTIFDTVVFECTEELDAQYSI